MAVATSPGISKRDLIRRISGEYPRTVYARINHLVKIGLLHVTLRPDSETALGLTDLGELVAVHVFQIDHLMERLYESLPEDEEAGL